MTKMFGNLTDDNLEKAGDVLGGGGIFESGVYEGIVKLAFAGKSQSSNAQSITVHIDVNGRELRETFWVTNKSGENFYADKQDATRKRPLPGFTSADDLCLLTTGLPLAEQTVEEKVVKLYSFEERKEIPQNVPVLTDLIGKPITAGVIKQVVDKRAKDNSGDYVPTGETREETVIDKFFHQATRRTVTEIREGLEEGAFLEAWAGRNTGKTRNRAKGGEGKTGAPARPAAQAGTARPAKSLFAS